MEPGQSIKIPTGVRVILDEDKFLLVAPRSSLGFKYRLQLDNTVGIIDADYCRAENQGHIFIKITNDSLKQNTLTVKKGDAFAQGIIMSYFLTGRRRRIGVKERRTGQHRQSLAAGLCLQSQQKTPLY